MTQTDPITDADLADLEALCAAATPGPWIATSDWSNYAVWSEPVKRDVVQSPSRVKVNNRWNEWTRENDAAFIATARTVLPRLIAALREARSDAACYRDAYEAEHTAHNITKAALEMAPQQIDAARADLEQARNLLKLATEMTERRTAERDAARAELAKLQAEMQRREQKYGLGRDFTDKLQRELAEAKVDLREAAALLDLWIDDGIDHDEREDGSECPEDDCCRCPRIARINAFFKRHNVREVTKP